MVFRDWLSKIRPARAISAKRAIRRKKKRDLFARPETLQPRMMLTDPLASISDAFATENDGTVTVDVVLSAPSTTPVTIDYSTSDGSATSPADFAAAFGSVTFAPGEIIQTIDVSITDDANIESSDESFYVDLTAAVGASIEDGQALVTINDRNFHRDNYTINHGNVHRDDNAINHGNVHRDDNAFNHGNVHRDNHAINHRDIHRNDYAINDRDVHRHNYAYVHFHKYRNIHNHQYRNDYRDGNRHQHR